MTLHFNPSCHSAIVFSVSVALFSLVLNWPRLLSLIDFSTSNVADTVPYVTDSRKGVSYCGTVAHGVEHFQNIFYAEDTSGAHRFAPPVPYDPPFGSVIGATTPGAVCPQGLGPASLPFASPITNVSENFLSLRIARPAGVSASAKLPVTVYIHGGT